MQLLLPIEILPHTELGALLAMSEKYEPQRPPILPPDVKIYYEEEDWKSLEHEMLEVTNSQFGNTLKKK